MNNRWRMYLDILKVFPHHEGTLLVCPSTHIFSLILVGYLHALFTADMAVSTYRGRLSAAIFLQRTAFHDVGRLTIAWKAMRTYEKQHKKKFKNWLTKEELIRVLNYIGTLPLTKALVVRRWVIAMMCEGVYRGGSVVAESRSANDCDFDFQQISIPERGVLLAEVPEKIGIHPIRRVRASQWDKAALRRGLFNAYSDVCKVFGVELGELKGPVMDDDGKPLSLRLFREWLEEIGRKLGLKFKLLPSVLRRSIIKFLATVVPQRHLKFIIGHLSDKTASQYYDGLTENETALVLDQVHQDWKPFEEPKKEIATDLVLEYFIDAQ